MTRYHPPVSTGPRRAVTVRVRAESNKSNEPFPPNQWGGGGGGGQVDRPRATDWDWDGGAQHSTASKRRRRAGCLPRRCSPSTSTSTSTSRQAPCRFDPASSLASHRTRTRTHAAYADAVRLRRLFTWLLSSHRHSRRTAGSPPPVSVSSSPSTRPLDRLVLLIKSVVSDSIVFFSYNKSVNSIFCHGLLAKRTRRHA